MNGTCLLGLFFRIDLDCETDDVDRRSPNYIVKNDVRYGSAIRNQPNDGMV